jgi:HEAT repeat protein
LNEQNPGVRLQSINAMTLQKVPDREVKSTLITALKTDENAGVRKEALLALKNFSMDDDIKQAFLFVLTHDSNPGLRIAAINYLDSARVVGKGYDQDVLSVLREKMQSDDNNYIRLRAKAAIEEIKQ